MHGYENSITIDIPVFSITYYKVPKKEITKNHKRVK